MKETSLQCLLFGPSQKKHANPCPKKHHQAASPCHCYLTLQLQRCSLSVRLSLLWSLGGKARWVLALSVPPDPRDLPQMGLKFQDLRMYRTSLSANPYWRPPG